MLKKLYKPRRNHSQNSADKISHQKKSPQKISAKLLASYALIAYGLVALAIIYFSYLSYDSYLNRKRLEMEAAAYEIEMNFSNTLSYAESLLNYINRQIVSSKVTDVEIVKILASFNRTHHGYNSIKDVISAGMFYWVDAKKQLIASSAGAVVSPIDLSSRDYLVNTEQEPWKIFTGTPVVGAASGQYVIPAAVGVLNNGGKYIGTSVVSFKIYNLVEKFKNLIGYYGSDFAILDNHNKLLMESGAGLFSEDKDLLNNLKFSNQSLHQELIADFSLFKQSGNFVLLRNLEKYPYKVLISYQNNILTKEILIELLPHAIEFLIITMFFATILILLRGEKKI